MVRNISVAVAAGFVAVALAGCLTDVADDPSALVGDDVLDEAPAWGMQLDGCLEHGWVAHYNRADGDTLAGVWALADITEEIGNPVRTKSGMPTNGMTGNWHQGIKCDTATFNGETIQDFQFGYVGRVVEAPVWDTGGADLHFLLAGFGLPEGPAQEGLRGISMADITDAVAATIDWYAGGPTADQAVVYQVYSDAQKGDYESYGLIERYRDVEPRTVRFWWQVPTDGSQSPLGHAHGPADMPEGVTWHPVYWDMTVSGGAQLATPPAAAAQWDCHWQDGAHGPQGGICGNSVTLTYVHGAVSMAYGGIVKDVVLDDAFTH